MENPNLSNCRIITVTSLVVRIFRSFTELKTLKSHNFSLQAYSLYSSGIQDSCPGRATSGGQLLEPVAQPRNVDYVSIP